MIDRRQWMQATVAVSSSGWLPALASAQTTMSRRRHCVVLWMSGGPSQIDTFDLKTGHTNGGPFKATATTIPGIRFSEHLPKLAQHAESMAVLRGISTKEGDHQRGTVVMRTGHIPGGPVRYPTIGSSLSKELRRESSDLPSYVTIAPGPFETVANSAGFLGPEYSPIAVAPAGPPVDDGFAQLRVDYLQTPDGLSKIQYRQRLALWRRMQDRFLSDRRFPNVIAHDTTYRSAIAMIDSDAKAAFDLSDESDHVRDAYGRGTFGQGCLMARRLIEHGVPLVEVTLGDGLGWDTHSNNFDTVKSLSAQLDAGWATLMTELSDRGLLEQTTILWAGEFGRTPVINTNGGRDHFPQAFTCVLAGGGIAGGQAYGTTSDDGAEVIDGKMNQQDLLATLCAALGVDPETENIAGGGRPIKIAEGNIVSEVLA